MAELSSNPVPFQVLEDETTPFRIGLELEVYGHANPTQLIDTVPHRTDISVLEEMKGSGGGKFTVLRSDPKVLESPEILDYQNCVKVRLDRKIVGAFLIQNNESKTVSTAERSDEVYELTGEGLRAWFRNAVVFPYKGIRKDSQGSRVFSFASEQGSWYKTADWVPPVKVHQYTMDPTPSNPWGTAPAEWPDAPTAWWIWGESNSAVSPAQEGINYFRYEFDIAESVGTKTYSIFCAADDEFDIYVDAAEVISTREANAYAQTWRADFELAPGHHIIAARVLNKGGVAALIAALFRAGNAETSEAAQLLTVTGDAGWLVNAYPDPAPGWTPGEVMLTLLSEAQLRGVRFPTWLTPTFTAEQDSDGTTWPRSLDWEFQLGTEYIDVIEKLEELVCDVWIDPETFALNMYIERGARRDVQSAAAQPVKFEIGRNVTKAGEEGTSDIKNSLLMETGDGWAFEADGLSTSIATYGRVEGFISTGASEAVSIDVARKVFETKATPETAATLEIIDVDDARPFIDFEVGDWVLAPDKTGETLITRRVMSLSLTEDQKTGEPKFTVEIDTIFEDRAQRYERWLKNTSDGSLGGSLSNASAGGGGGSASPAAQTTQKGAQGLQGLTGPAGMFWAGEWSAAIEYSRNDAVSYGGSSWIALIDSVAVTPSLGSPSWDLLASEGEQGEGIEYRGAWLTGTQYLRTDVVRHAEEYWIAVVDFPTGEPSLTSTDWDLFVASNVPDTAAYSAISVAANKPLVAAWSSLILDLNLGSTGLTHDPVAGTLTVVNAGVYEISAQFFAQIASATNFREYTVSKNGVEIAYMRSSAVTNSSLNVEASLSPLPIECVAGDVIALRTGGTSTATLLSGTGTRFRMISIGGPAGPQGEQGEQGLQGLVGPKGDKGDTGVGLIFRGDWVSTVTYQPNDFVIHNGLQWATAVTNTNSEPGISPDWSEFSGGGGGGGTTLLPRTVTSVTTASLASLAAAQMTFPLAIGYRLLRVSTSSTSRVRMYNTVAQRTSDLSRVIGTDPQGDHGLVFEFVSSPDFLAASLSPVVEGASLETTPVADIPITITNLDLVAQAVTVSLTWIQTE